MAPISSICKPLLLAVPAAWLAGAASALEETHLLYLEAQGLAGYSSYLDKPIFYSMNPEAEMQKPSVGFDYLGRLSGARGDWGALGLQGRLALIADTTIERVQPQLYNAWFKVKTPWTDAWIGHNRPALGLGSYFDSHALLLRTLSVQGFGYDRDWGIGVTRDLAWGNLQFSATTGSGMPLYFRGNFMLAGRVGYGVLNEDNFTVGLSLGGGQTLDTMGYELREPDPLSMGLAQIDIAFLRDNLEHRLELLSGEWLGDTTSVAMYRLGILLDAEGRTKLEAQPTCWTSGADNWQFEACVSRQLTSDLTFRTMYEYDHNDRDQRVVLQLYFYMPA